MTKKKDIEKNKKKTYPTPGKYHFTVEETRANATEVARKQIDREIIMNEKKSVMAGYTDRIKRIDLDINKLSRCIVDGYDIRDFECYIEKDFNAHLKRYIDIHTKKIVDERPLDPSDYQKELQL